MCRVNWKWLQVLIVAAALTSLQSNTVDAHPKFQDSNPPAQTKDEAKPNADETEQSESTKTDEPSTAQTTADAPAAATPAPRRPTFDKQSAEILESLKPITEAVNRVTVNVLARGRPVALGTIVDSEGFVLTKASELKGGLTCKLSDGRAFSAQVFGIHKKTDLALLKIDASQLPTVEWSSAEAPAVGYWVVTPKAGSDPLLGIVSVKPRAIAPPTGYIGIQMVQHKDGVRIDKVSANSPAERAGLRVNDIIFELNGQKITEQSALREAIQKNAVGTEVTLKVLRAEQPLEFQVQLSELSSFEPGILDRSNVQNEMGGRLSKRRLDFPLAIQHDTPLTPSECGGPLIDLDGKIVGVNIARAGRVDSLALPTATVLSVIDSLKSGQLAPTVIYKTEIDKIQARLVEISSELDQLPLRKSELSDQLNRDAARLDELRKVFEDVQARLKELEAEHAQTSEKLNGTNSSSSKLSKEKERLEAQLQALSSGTN